MKTIDFLPKNIPEPIQSQERKIDLSELTRKTPEQDLFEKIGGVFAELIYMFAQTRNIKLIVSVDT